jgi:hypothetical protein
VQKEQHRQLVQVRKMSSIGDGTDDTITDNEDDDDGEEKLGLLQRVLFAVGCAVTDYKWVVLGMQGARRST